MTAEEALVKVRQQHGIEHVFGIEARLQPPTWLPYRQSA